MRRLFQLLYKYRAFFIFLLLELFSGWLIVQNNIYQSASVFNTSNAMVASIIRFSNSVTSYFSLTRQNQLLAEENTYLRDQIELLKKTNQRENSSDAALLDQYEFETAKVINNSVRNTKNHITINKGEEDNILPGMGVVSGSGVVGKTKYTSSHYTVIISLLHSDFLVSSKIPGRVELCTTSWNGVDPRYAEVLYVPRHIDIKKGDTVVTSGYDGIFPEDILIGIVDQISIQENEAFYNIDIQLSNDFNKLAYVQVVKNKLQTEKDSLEEITRGQ